MTLIFPKVVWTSPLNCTRVRVSKISLRATTNLMRVKHKYARVTHGYHSWRAHACVKLRLDGTVCAIYTNDPDRIG